MGSKVKICPKLALVRSKITEDCEDKIKTCGCISLSVRYKNAKVLVGYEFCDSLLTSPDSGRCGEISFGNEKGSLNLVSFLMDALF